MKKNELPSWTKSISLIIFGWSQCRIKRSSRSQNMLVSGLLRTCFTATVFLFLLSTPRHTSPNPPFPKTFSSIRFIWKCFPTFCNFEPKRTRTRFLKEDILDNQMNLKQMIMMGYTLNHGDIAVGIKLSVKVEGAKVKGESTFSTLN